MTLTKFPDAALIANGYEPNACDGKRSVAPKWSSRPNTVEALAAERAAHSNALNTGARCGRLSVADIDITNPAHVMEIKKVIAANLGETLLERVGAKGCALCYRNEAPTSKITVGTREKRLVEFLGIGQQVVILGTHPDTGRDYEWPNDYLGGDPLQTPLADLPEVTPAMLYDAAHAAAARLKTLGYGEVTVTGIKTPREDNAAPVASGKPVSPAIIEAMLCSIPPSCDRNEWLIVCGGLVAAPVADPAWDGLDLFIRWSRGDLHGGETPANFAGPEDCEAQWQRDMGKLHGN